MKTKNIIALALFAVVMLGIWQFRTWREAQLVKTMGGFQLPDVTDRRTPEDKARDKFMALQAEAEGLLLGRITNTVGYRRHTGYHLLNYDPDPNQWQAVVTVESFNRFGGVVAEFRCYKFAKDDTGIELYLDPKLTSAR